MSEQGRYGFLFWLQWICWFAGTLVLTSGFWTILMTRWFGSIRGNELTVTWALGVFGSWFLLVVPFIRKKERIWKRLNDDQEKAVDAWLRGVGGLIGIVIATCFFWCAYFGEAALTSPGWNGSWVKAVFVTWLVVLMPLLIWMYKKADQIMKGAMERQTAAGPRFQTGFVEKSKRMLPASLAKKVQASPPLLDDGHVVTMILKTGERVPNVFVLKNKEVLGVYDRDSFDVNMSDVMDIECADAGNLPEYEEAKWLRLDGRA